MARGRFLFGTVSRGFKLSPTIDVDWEKPMGAILGPGCPEVDSVATAISWRSMSQRGVGSDDHVYARCIPWAAVVVP
jgi:hypothetical protein